MGKNGTIMALRVPPRLRVRGLIPCPEYPCHVMEPGSDPEFLTQTFLLPNTYLAFLLDRRRGKRVV